MAKLKQSKRREEGKKVRKKRPTSKKWELYKEGKRRFCPKCGPGVFMADHKNRHACGKCGYTEFVGKSEQTEKPKEEKE